MPSRALWQLYAAARRQLHRTLRAWPLLPPRQPRCAAASVPTGHCLPQRLWTAPGLPRGELLRTGRRGHCPRL